MLVHTVSGVHDFTDSGFHEFRFSLVQMSRFTFETMHCIDIKKVLPRGKRSSGGGAEPGLSDFPIFHSFYCHFRHFGSAPTNLTNVQSRVRSPFNPLATVRALLKCPFSHR